MIDLLGMTTPARSRRAWLKTASSGFGYLAFAGLAHEAAARDRGDKADPLAPKPPKFPARAKRVLFLCMKGGPSHVDTFDYKPDLQAGDGKEVTNRLRGGTAKLLGSPWEFRQSGRSGLWISELFPELARHADDLCLVRGMQTDVPAHPQAFLQMHTGSFQFVRPSMGAWTLYGLGTENANLPGFISLNPPSTNGGSQNYGNAFLPAIYQGTRIGAEGRPAANAQVSHIENPRFNAEAQKNQLEFIQALNRGQLAPDGSNPGIEGVIDSYELAFRMQGEVPLVMDLSGESEATRAAYGVGQAPTDDFARQCLLARRFLEAGVRFVEITHGDWDQHRNLRADHARHASAIDKPIAALLADLKQRGLLEDTLVIWGGEFGRTPTAQNNDGRDHNHKGYTIWLAGAGVKGGFSHGETDEIGAEAVSGKVHVHDLHATILHLLGLDHEQLTYRHAGRDFRLTDVHGNVVREILA